MCAGRKQTAFKFAKPSSLMAVDCLLYVFDCQASYYYLKGYHAFLAPVLTPLNLGTTTIDFNKQP